MAKIYPKRSMNDDGYSDEYASPNREIFTVWMKSLVISGNGCTVYNSEGRVVFRVDNYQTKSSSETLLMNFHGEVLFSLKKKKLLIFRRWEGYQWINSMIHKEGLWFKLKKKWKVFGRGLVSCNVILRCKKITSYLKILGLERKLALRIMDCEGRVMAEMIRKQTSSGVSLGEDVLSLVVEPQVDQSLVMALVLGYAMINNKL